MPNDEWRMTKEARMANDKGLPPRNRPGPLTFVLRHSLFPVLAVFMLLTGLGRAVDKSGVSPNAISLPKGPGSIEGLGESFQPSLNTGTAKDGIGLKLPPGVGGHAPRLDLSYEGGGGNGPLGFGWNLSLHSRQT